MERRRAEFNTNEIENNNESIEGRQLTVGQIKKFCKSLLDRVVEPLSATEAVKDMPREQRLHVGEAAADMASNNINPGSYYY